MSMKEAYKTAMIGIGLSLSFASIYLIITWGSYNSRGLPAYSDLILETYKTLLTFSLITVGGIALKALIDQVIEKDRNKQIDLSRYEETRKIILKEFAIIFSEFYAIRKLYHSALSHKGIYDKSSNDFINLIRSLLQKSVDMEGRFGALKVLIITHFNLPRGEYQNKNIEELKKSISSEKALTTSEQSQKKLIRLGLDLLGESYDDWRHAFEHNRKIEVDEVFWKEYDTILQFLEKRD